MSPTMTIYVVLYSRILRKTLHLPPRGGGVTVICPLSKRWGWGRIHPIYYFRLCPPPPSFVGTYYLRPPDTRAIFLQNELLCNGTSSVTAGRITYWGGGEHKRKRSLFRIILKLLKIAVSRCFLL